MKDEIEITHKGVTVRAIKRTLTRNNGKSYTDWVINDYSSGRRRRITRASEAEARKTMKQIAEAMATGRRRMASWTSSHWSEVEQVYQVVSRHGLTLGRAASVLDSALAIGIKPEEVVLAAQFWKQHRPNKPITHKRVTDAVTEFLAKKKGLSDTRQRTLSLYLKWFKDHFGDRLVHELTDVEIKDFVDQHEWAPKTVCDWLNSISLLFKEAIFRAWVPPGHNPCSSIKRPRLPASRIEIFEPPQVRTIMTKVRENLVPFLAIWFFAGARKQEIARLKWHQIRTALKTGFIVIEEDQGLKTGGRSVPILPALRSWVEWYLGRHPDVDGLVLPARYSSGRNLAEVTKKITLQTGVPWAANGPRHSFCTYHLTKFKDGPQLIKSVGNSFRALQRHYWNKSNSVTEERATEYFTIDPADCRLQR